MTPELDLFIPYLSFSVLLALLQTHIILQSVGRWVWVWGGNAQMAPPKVLKLSPVGQCWVPCLFLSQSLWPV